MNHKIKMHHKNLGIWWKIAIVMKIVGFSAVEMSSSNASLVQTGKTNIFTFQLIYIWAPTMKLKYHEIHISNPTAKLRCCEMQFLSKNKEIEMATKLYYCEISMR